MNCAVCRLRLSTLLALAAGGLLLASQPAISQVQGQDCSYLVADRSYSQAFGGFLNVPMYFGSFGVPSPPGVGLVPNGGAGFITFLRDGTVKGRITLALGGLGLDQDLTFTDVGQYVLTWDITKKPIVCSGPLSFGIPGVAQFDFQLLVTREGRQIEMIHTDAGLIVSVTGYPVETQGCGNQTIEGRFSEDMRGWALSSQKGPLGFPPEQLLGGYFPFAASGAVEFRPRVLPPSPSSPGLPAGSRSVVAWDSTSLNGAISQRVMTGWYKVNPDCSGAMAWRERQGNADSHFEMFVGESGGALYLVNTDTVTVPGLPGPIPAYVIGTTLTRTLEKRD